MRYLLSSILLFFGVSAITGEEIETDTIFPSKDTYLNGMMPTVNFGSAEELCLNHEEGPTKWILMKFDLPFTEVTPDSVVVDEAKIALYSYFAGGKGEVMSSALGEDWDELVVTYSNRPAPGSSMGVPDSLDGEIGWQFIDVAPFAQAYALNTIPNHGFEIMLLSATEVDFYSNDYSNSLLRPRLYLTYHYEGSSIGEEIVSEPVGFDVSVETVEEVAITYCIPCKAKISLRIYDGSGKLVDKVQEGLVNRGRHEATWIAVKSGLYFVRLDIDNAAFTEKIVIIR